MKNNILWVDDEIELLESHIIYLTDKGYNLEKKLSSIQTNKIKTTLDKFDEDAINNFKKILFEMIEADNKKIFQQLNE